MNLGQVLTLKQNDIIQGWRAQVQGNNTALAQEEGKLESAQQLTYAAVLDSLPQFLEALEQVLSQPIYSTDEAFLQEAPLPAPNWPHCAINLRQNYDPEEIVREYSVLRKIILDVLEVDLLSRSPSVLLRSMRLIESAIDRVMADSLQRCTESRLSAVNLLYDELLASNRELERLVRSEKIHLAHLAHELKSPLSGIIGYSDLFLRQYASSAEVHADYIDRVLTSGRQLLQMINEALEVSSYQANEVKLNCESVQVCEVVEDVTVMLEALAQQKGLSMSMVCSLVNQPIVTDKGRLRQIVTNLMSNAIRYTEAGSIQVRVQLVNATEETMAEEGVLEEAAKSEFDQVELEPALAGMRHVEIAVVDTGLGIDVAEQAQIFKPYYRGKAGRQLSCSTGLGLAITYQMVKLLQGDIHVQSEPGGGSVFTIALPLYYQNDGIEAMG
jgi:signal transduction histidine kinase